MGKQKVTDGEFIQIVTDSISVIDALKNCGLTVKCSAYRYFYARCDKLKISIAHFKSCQRSIKQSILDEKISSSVKKNLSRRASLIELKLNHNSSSNVKWIDKAIDRLGIDTSHWTGQAHLKGKTHNWSIFRPLNEILIPNATFTLTVRLKKRLISLGSLKNECYICHLTEWQDKSISLQIDHINGDCFDHRIENLRILCPNCHSQTSTFCRRKINKIEQSEEIKDNFCLDCKIKISDSSERCKSCSKKLQPTKIQWPSKEELQELIWKLPTSTVAKQLGVSDKAIEKHCKTLGLNKPPRGYWAKLKNVK